ncbi:hypothetical protein [Thermococcus litoralis]|uniref:hypothetical protein n=1 Tax=Thermococcus litoralis TaxID=2265 RepID=UPI000B352A69|nr:hypothetical protein [Thermococcus litoralis]
MEINDPRAVKFVILHPFIALILSHHSAAETSTIGKAVSDTLDVFYGQMGKTYEDAKKEQDKLIDYIITMAEFNHLPIVKEKLREQLRQGLPKAFKIVDKLLPDNSKEHAKLLRKALDYDVKDPLVILKQAGIDIEPELEEFRQFLAEISGKKMEEKPKFPQVQKQTEKGDIPTELPNLPSDAFLEVLSILQALEFADYSEKAKEKALQKLSSMIEGLLKDKPTPENLLKLGLYTYAVELIKRGEFSRAEEIKKLQ